VAVGAGQTVIWLHANSQGRVGPALTDWPPHCPITLAVDRPTLIMFAHPKCPCTPASIEELASIARLVSGRVAAHVVFLKPPRVSADWARTWSRRQAEAIDGVDVREDDGSLAHLFGARTSGHVVIYGPEGRLRFRGGIVGSRGQTGDNPARRGALAALVEPTTTTQSMADFGCPLFSENDDVVVRRPK
jgi:hypothetical protein